MGGRAEAPNPRRSPQHARSETLMIGPLRPIRQVAANPLPAREMENDDPAQGCQRVPAVTRSSMGDVSVRSCRIPAEGSGVLSGRQGHRGSVRSSCCLSRAGPQRKRSNEATILRDLSITQAILFNILISRTNCHATLVTPNPTKMTADASMIALIGSYFQRNPVRIQGQKLRNRSHDDAGSAG